MTNLDVDSTSRLELDHLYTVQAGELLVFAQQDEASGLGRRQFLFSVPVGGKLFPVLKAVVPAGWHLFAVGLAQTQVDVQPADLSSWSSLTNTQQQQTWQAISAHWTPPSDSPNKEVPTDVAAALAMLVGRRLELLATESHTELVQAQELAENSAQVDEELIHDSYQHLAHVEDRSPHIARGANLRRFVGGDRLSRLQGAAEAVAYNIGVRDATADIVDESGEDAQLLRDSLRASGTSLREVTLTDHWWRKSVGPLVALRAPADPVALITKRNHYVLWDPKDGSSIRVGKRTASELLPTAYMLYRAMPDGITSVWQLMRFAARGHGRTIAIILAMGLIGGIVSLAMPLGTGTIFNDIVPTGSVSLLMAVGGLLLGTIIFSSSLHLVRNFAFLRLEGLFQLSLEPAIWDRLLRLPASFFRKYSVGDMAKRVNAINKIRTIVTGPVTAAFMSLVFSSFSLALLFYYSSTLALLAIAGLILQMIVLVWLSWRQLIQERLAFNLGGDLAGREFQLLRSVPKLRVAGAEARALRFWSRKFEEQQLAQFRSGKIEIGVTAVMTAAPVLITIVLYWYMATNLLGELPTGSFLAFMVAFGQFSSAMSSLNGLIGPLTMIIPVWERLKPILVEPLDYPLTAVAPGRLTGNIHVDNVSFRYESSGPLAVQDISLRVRPGELVAITGPSGSGKSTLMRLLLGFETPTTGSLSFDGHLLENLDKSAFRRQLGVVTQEMKPAEGDILDNIVGDSGRSEDEAWQAAEKVGIADDIHAMPMGMRTHVTAMTMSGGQIQRLLLARALVHQPRIVLLDEATSALDNETQEIVTHSLDELKAARVVIAHRLSTLKRADYVYVIEAGKITQEGSYAALAASPGLFKDLVDRQSLKQ